MNNTLNFATIGNVFISAVFIVLSSCKFQLLVSSDNYAYSWHGAIIAVQFLIGIGLFFKFRWGRYLIIIFSVLSLFIWFPSMYLSIIEQRLHWFISYLNVPPILYLIFYNLSSTKALFTK